MKHIFIWNLSGKISSKQNKDMGSLFFFLILQAFILAKILSFYSGGIFPGVMVQMLWMTYSMSMKGRAKKKTQNPLSSLWKTAWVCTTIFKKKTQNLLFCSAAFLKKELSDQECFQYKVYKVTRNFSAYLITKIFIICCKQTTPICLFAGEICCCLHHVYVW